MERRWLVYAVAAAACLMCLPLSEVMAEGRVETREVTYKDGDQTLKGYIAYEPSQQGKRPGIVVVHEWYGLNDYAKLRARQLAGMGYVALAADMYGDGVVAETRDEAAKLAGKIRSDRGLMRRRAGRALAELKADERVDPGRTAAIGYCFGGGCVLELARSGADLNGVVSFHGNLDTPNPEATAKPKASILVCHGAADPHVPTDSVEAFQKEMHACGADWQLNMYGGAVHAFTNPDSGDDPSTGAAYDPVAARRAWEDMKRFLEEVLGTNE
jgi:dienelactone hydrolase